MKTPLIIILIISFIITSCIGPLPAYAQDAELQLPEPGVMVHLSPPVNLPMLKGIKVNPDNPFRFEFILDRGDGISVIASAAKQSQQEQLKTESTKLIKYFLASLTIPEDDLWVNLSPYEKNRIIPQSFGLTEMGRDLLAEDYMLKQITASLIYPEGEIGKKFWKRVYGEAFKRYGTTNIPVNTFNKVWIVPAKAVVYENSKAGTAYVVESTLKVMLEQDYLSLEKHNAASPLSVRYDTHSIGANIVRELVIPELTKEVNTGQNFAQLRQVYNSLILATWYKKKIRDSILEQVYAGKNKVKGLLFSSALIENPEYIYQQYLKAFKKGVFNYIKEESVDVSFRGGVGEEAISKRITIPRKYFSGGMLLAPERAMLITRDDKAMSRVKTKGLMVLGLSIIALWPFYKTDHHRSAKPKMAEVQVVQAAGPVTLETDKKVDDSKWREGVIGFMDLIRISPNASVFKSNLGLAPNSSEEDILSQVNIKFKIGLELVSLRYFTNNTSFNYARREIEIARIRMGENRTNVYEGPFEKSLELYDKRFHGLSGNYLTSDYAFKTWMDFLKLEYTLELQKPGNFNTNMVTVRPIHL